MKNLKLVTSNKFEKLFKDESGNLYHWNIGTASENYWPVSACTKEDYNSKYEGTNETSNWSSVGGIGIVYGRKESMKKPLKSNQVNLVG